LTDHANPTGYSQVIMETQTDASGVPIKRIVYTIGHDQISQTVYQAADTSGNGTIGPEDGWGAGVTHYFGTDGHGSVRVLYDALASIALSAQNLAQIFHFDAYGNLLNMPAASALTSYLYSGESFDTSIHLQYLRARWYDATSGRFISLDPFGGNDFDPQSLHKYLYVHSDPVNSVDPSGNFFTVIHAGITYVTRIILAHPRVVAGLALIDKLSTLADVVKLLAILSAGGAVPPGLLAGLLISVVPFASLFNKARFAFNGGIDLLRFLTHGGAGKLANSTDELSDVYKALKSTGDLSGKKLTQTAGEVGAVIIAKKLGLEAIEDFPTRYHGIDGLFKYGDSIVIVEAKGHAASSAAKLGITKSGEQLSQNWIKRQIEILRSHGDTKWADMIENAIRTDGGLKVMVSATPVKESVDEVLDPVFEMKNWENIGLNVF
jgi:RHS repeat-associated protein